jgi:hypothetical protein
VDDQADVEATTPVDDDEVVDPTELADAPVGATTSLDRLTAAFPGATLVDDDQP